MKMLPLCLSLVVPVLASATALEEIRAFVDAQKESGRIDPGEPGWKTSLPEFPKAEFEDDAAYEWVIETSEGTLVAELNEQAAPNHVRNILYLSTLGFYDGLGFHRVIPGFMAQGGCPTGTGGGGPGYSVDLEVKPDVRHDRRGTLSMARSRNPNSAGSQFFITFGPTPNLDGGYTVFGRVTEGMEVLEALEAAGNPDPLANGVPPRKDLRILSTKVRPARPGTPAPDPAP